MRLVLDAERVVEALQLRDPLCSGIWPPSKPAGTVPRAFWPLVPRPAVLPPLPPMPRPTRLRRLVRARGGLQVVDLHGHGSCSVLDRDEVRDPGEHPRISGRSGRVLVLPMRPRPRARSVPRCFGLVPMAERDLGDLEARPSRDLVRRRCGPRSRLAGRRASRPLGTNSSASTGRAGGRPRRAASAP